MRRVYERASVRTESGRDARAAQGVTASRVPHETVHLAGACLRHGASCDRRRSDLEVRGALRSPPGLPPRGGADDPRGASSVAITDAATRSVADRMPGGVVPLIHSIGLEHYDHPQSLGTFLNEDFALEDGMVVNFETLYFELGWGCSSSMTPTWSARARPSASRPCRWSRSYAQWLHDHRTRGTRSPHGSRPSFGDRDRPRRDAGSETRIVAASDVTLQASTPSQSARLRSWSASAALIGPRAASRGPIKREKSANCDKTTE